MEGQSESRRDKFLCELYQHTLKTSLGLSRFFRLKGEEEHYRRQSLKGQEKSEQLPKTCPYCGQEFTSQGHHHVRVKPRQKMTRKHRKLLQKFETDPNSLGRYQRNCLQNFLYSKNTVAITCHTCSKTTFIPGSSRSFVKDSKPGHTDSASMKDEEAAPLTKKSRKEIRKAKKKEKRKMKKEEEKKGIETPVSVSSEKNLPIQETRQRTPNPEVVTPSKTSSTHNMIPTDKHVLNMQKRLAKDNGKCAKIELDSKNNFISGKKRSLDHDDKGLSKKKSKKKHQMLSKILQEDKSGDTDSSLSAFLCSL